MNQRPDKTASGSGQAPLPPPAPRTAAPSPTRTSVTELQKRSDSTPSFTKRKRMEKALDEQRWKRTDLHLIHYMSKLKDEYMQRQTATGQPSRKLADAAAHERQERATETHATMLQQTDDSNPRVTDVLAKPSSSSVRNVPKSMIPIRSPPRNKSVGHVEELGNDEAPKTRKDPKGLPKMLKKVNIRRAVSSGGTTPQKKDDIKEEAKFTEDDDIRPHLSTDRDEIPLHQTQAQAKNDDRAEAEQLNTNLRGLGMAPREAQNDFKATNLTESDAAGASKINFDMLEAKESNAVKRVSSGTAKMKNDNMKEESKLALTTNRALSAKDSLSHRRGYQTQSLSKLKSAVSKDSTTELKATASERLAKKTNSLTKTNVHSSLRRSRWSGMLLEDSKQKEKRGDITVSPNLGKALTTKEEQTQIKTRPTLQTRVAQGRLASKNVASKQSEKLAEENLYTKIAPLPQKQSRHGSNLRGPKASRERVIGTKTFPARKTSSPSRLMSRKETYQAAESSNEGSDEEAACVRETPSVAVTSVKPHFLITKSAAKKVTSYQISSPPSSKKSLSAQKGNVKGKPYRSRSPVIRESKYRYVPEGQPSDVGVNESISRSFTDRERHSSTLLSSPSKRLGRQKFGVGVVKKSASQVSKVTEKLEPPARRRNIDMGVMGQRMVDRKLKRSRYTETSDLFPIERKDMYSAVESKKQMSVENRCTQVECWPDDWENDNVPITRLREGDHISPKRIPHRAHHEDIVDARRLHRHMTSCKYRPKIVCCHRPPFRVHGRKGKRARHRRRYKYIVDPSLYDYLRKIHIKKGTLRRKCESLPYESAHRFDTSETSYASLRDLELSETSYSKSEESSGNTSSEYSANSCSSSMIQRKSNTVACLSLKDTATLCWNMSESNVQVQSSTRTSSVHKMSKDKRSRSKKVYRRHNNHETTSEKSPKKIARLAKDTRRASRAPAASMPQQAQVKPLKLDQPPEGPDSRPGAEMSQPAPPREVTIEKNVFTVPQESESDQESRELDAIEAEISKAVEQLCQSQREIEMKFEMVLESFNQLKENRRQILSDLAEIERQKREAVKPNPPKWEATYFDYFMFLTFLTVQIVFHIVFIKKL